jgi:hypothetical protein
LSSSYVLCTQYCQFLLIVHSWLPLQVSLTCIYMDWDWQKLGVFFFIGGGGGNLFNKKCILVKYSLVIIFYRSKFLIWSTRYINILVVFCNYFVFFIFSGNERTMMIFCFMSTYL